MVGYYDLARDARAEVKKVGSGEEREVWRERLRGLGVCVGNALVEMGDLEGARRHFEVLRGDAGGKERRVLEGRLALLCLRIGDVRAARRYAGEGAMMEALLCMADGRYGDAVEGWRGMVAGERDVLARQNMAVCELYLGRMDEVWSMSSVLLLEYPMWLEVWIIADRAIDDRDPRWFGGGRPFLSRFDVQPSDRL